MQVSGMRVRPGSRVAVGMREGRCNRGHAWMEQDGRRHVQDGWRHVHVKVQLSLGGLPAKVEFLLRDSLHSVRAIHVLVLESVHALSSWRGCVR